MPKQKQKQCKNSCNCSNVGTTKKSKSRRRRPKSAPTPKPQSISVLLQGSSMNLPLPLTNEYNNMIQQLDFMRRQQAASGSLIPQMARNDLLNRVQATNPFTVRSTNLQAEMLNPYEGVMEEVVESGTTQNAYDNNTYNAKIPIDQDFIRSARIEKLGQNLGKFTDKIGVVEDVETISDITAYDDEDLEDRLASSVSSSVSSSTKTYIKPINLEELYIETMKKDLSREVLDKNWERFLRKAQEEEAYKTRRINIPFPPNLEEPIPILEQIVPVKRPRKRKEKVSEMSSEMSKKESAARATSNLISDVGKLTPKTNPVGRPKTK